MATGYELDWAQPLQAGFNLGLKLQDMRQAKRDKERMIDLSNSRLELERQQENRLKEQQMAIIKERELDRTKAEAIQRDSARFNVDVEDALSAGATPIQAKASAAKLNPFAVQVRDSIDEFVPKPAPRVTPINFGQSEVVDVDGRVVVNPEPERQRRELIQNQSAQYRLDELEALNNGATALKAKTAASMANPLAVQVRESIDQFVPKPAPRVTPINFGDADAVDVDGRVIVKPSKTIEPAAVRTARAVADAEIAAGRATEDDRAAIEADNMKKQDPVIRRSTQVVDSMIKGGLLPESKRDKTIAEMSENGGKILKPNETTLLKLGDRVATLEMSDQLEKDINSFDSKFGKGALDSYVGQFDAPFNKALDIIKKRKTPQDVEALRVFQTFQDIKNGKIKTISGATVTADEGKRADAAIGSVLNKNFVNQFRTFLANEKSTFKSTVDTLEGYKLPKNVRAAAGGSPVEVESSVTIGPVRVSSQAEYEALKPGDRFIDGSGKVKTKRAK